MGVAAAVAVLRHAVKRRRISLRECGDMAGSTGRKIAQVRYPMVLVSIDTTRSAIQKQSQ